MWPVAIAGLTVSQRDYGCVRNLQYVLTANTIGQFEMFFGVWIKDDLNDSSRSRMSRKSPTVIASPVYPTTDRDVSPTATSL